MRRGEKVDFEIDGQVFSMTRLPPDKSLRGWRYLAGVIGPLFEEVANAPDGSFGDLGSKLYGCLEHLPELFELFKPYCKTQTEADGQWMPLTAVGDHIFTGDPEATLAFIVHCVQVEYSGFLSARGRAVMTAAGGNLFTSLTGLSGTSGES